MKISLVITTVMLLTTLSLAQSKPQQQEMQEMAKIMQEVQKKIKANPNMSEEEKKALMMQAMNNSSMMQNRLKEQKEKMPKILTLLKSNRECLSHADTKTDADKCAKKSKQMAKKIGLKDEFDEEENEDFVWNKEEKTKVLADMDNAIAHMEKILPCIQNAQNMSDMMTCSKGRR
jgi:hypothetical protein